MTFDHCIEVILKDLAIRSLLIGIVFFISYCILDKIFISSKKLISNHKNTNPNVRILKIMGPYRKTSKKPKNKVDISKYAFKTSFFSKIIILIKHSRLWRKISIHGIRLFVINYILPLILSLFVFLLVQHHVTILPKNILFIVILILMLFSVNSFTQKLYEIKKNKFVQNFPNTIDSFKRSMKAGFTISKSIEIAGKDSGFKPISKLFKEMHEKIELGMSVQNAVKLVSAKSDIDEFKFFAVTLSLYSSNGGNIIEILNNCSNLIRKRSQLAMKIKAVSSEARMTGYILLSLPFIIASIIYFINPEHLMVLVNSDNGKTLLLITSIMFITGAILMFKITHIRV